MPISVESRAGGGTLNAWVNVTTGANVTVGVSLITYAANGAQHAYQGPVIVTTGSHQLSAFVPEGGIAELVYSTSTYYSTVNSYAWEFNYP